MLKLCKWSPLLLRAMKFFGYFYYVYSNKQLRKISIAVIITRRARQPERAPHVALTAPPRLSRAGLAARNVCQVECPLALKIRSANVACWQTMSPDFESDLLKLKLRKTRHPGNPRKHNLKDLFHFMFNLHSTKYITDCCYLSLYQCRDLNQQNLIYKLLLFKLGNKDNHILIMCQVDNFYLG